MLVPSKKLSGLYLQIFLTLEMIAFQEAFGYLQVEDGLDFGMFRYQSIQSCQEAHF